MPRRNRVDPWGDLHAVPGRGLLTGNRGCLVDDDGEVVRHHAPFWICCLTEFPGGAGRSDAPRRWTPIFFLDDVVALAAGHRPCGLCRREAYRSYRDAVTAAVGSSAPLSAGDLNRRLAAERLERGRGVDRARDRRRWEAPVASLPPGTVIVSNDLRPWLLLEDRRHPFTFDGWGPPRPRSRQGRAQVLTPPTSVAALTHGYTPLLHPSAETAT